MAAQRTEIRDQQRAMVGWLLLGLVGVGVGLAVSIRFLAIVGGIVVVMAGLFLALDLIQGKR
jgi:hypothetical protein